MHIASSMTQVSAITCLVFMTTKTTAGIFTTINNTNPFWEFLVPSNGRSEKAMAPHSSVLAWRIPGTGEPGELPSLGSHRVGHDWSNLAAAGSVHKTLCFSFLPSFTIALALVSPFLLTRAFAWRWNSLGPSTSAFLRGHITFWRSRIALSFRVWQSLLWSPRRCCFKVESTSKLGGSGNFWVLASTFLSPPDWHLTQDPQMERPLSV